MRPTQLPLIGNRALPAATPRRSDRLILGVVLAWWTLFLFCTPVPSAEPGPAPGSKAGSIPFGMRDGQLMIAVRRSLMEDATLAPLNLGVGVRHGVATLWGPVPTAAAALRALERARKVPGLDEVRSELYLRPPDDPRTDLPTPLPQRPTPRPVSPPP